MTLFRLGFGAAIYSSAPQNKSKKAKSDTWISNIEQGRVMAFSVEM